MTGAGSLSSGAQPVTETRPALLLFMNVISPLLPEESGQRSHPLREVFNGLRYIVKTGAPWRWMPNDLPPWDIVYQQARRWLRAGCFEALAEDLRTVLRLAAGRPAHPSAAIINSRTLRSTPESGTRAGYDGAKRKKGSKLYMAVDTLGHLLALHGTPASEDDRSQVGRMAEAIQAATDESVDIAFADQGYTGERAATAAAAHKIALEVVKLPEAKRGFVLLPRRWVVERSIAWSTRFRLVKDYERCAETLADLHLVAFVCIMLKNAAPLAAGAQQSLAGGLLTTRIAAHASDGIRLEPGSFGNALEEGGVISAHRPFTLIQHLRNVLSADLFPIRQLETASAGLDRPRLRRRKCSTARPLAQIFCREAQVRIQLVNAADDEALASRGYFQLSFQTFLELLLGDGSGFLSF